MYLPPNLVGLKISAPTVAYAVDHVNASNFATGKLVDIHLATIGEHWVDTAALRRAYAWTAVSIRSCAHTRSSLLPVRPVERTLWAWNGWSVEKVVAI